MIFSLDPSHNPLREFSMDIVISVNKLRDKRFTVHCPDDICVPHLFKIRIILNFHISYFGTRPAFSMFHLNHPKSLHKFIPFGRAVYFLKNILVIILT